MAHWNGIRSGWNMRGGTDKDHQIIDQNLQEDLAVRALELIATKIGKKAYQAWFDATWPGHSINTTPWSEIYKTAHAYLNLLEAGDVHPN